jgi:predicted membrane metal-binding protein
MITTGFIMLAIMAAISATLLILAKPEPLMGASFQMTYAAVVALVVLYERWNFHGTGAEGPSAGR